MTFEEFFVKKKIDLNALAKAEPELFTEFKSHYNLMGEKSFDHTKKFWFNKLRRLYHLSTPEKAVTQLETKIASQAEPLSSPTIEQKAAPLPDSAEPVKTVHKPGFRPRSIPVAKSEEKKEEISPIENLESAAAPVKKPGFKPRNIKPADQGSEDARSLESRPGKTEVSDTPIVKSESISEPAQAASKPKFQMRNVPRNPGGIAEQTGDSTEEKLVPEAENAPRGVDQAQPESADAPKPGYKPRFNLKNLPKKAEGSEPDAADLNSEGSPVSENASEGESSEAPKPAYKPRFNMKNIPPQKPVEKSEEEKESVSDLELPQSAPAAEKPAYKPRFNMKSTPKPKAAEQVSQKSDEGVTEGSGEKTEVKAEEVKGEESVQNPGELPAAKPAYKPRFNMKNIKPKPPESTE
ncbi:hypothetical protein [Desertivirga brevis]|uniref:hypothetical protein n=1 Tax=Desertivirga brevis TaxID=2810310 RepID=UPI001A97A5C3|nr:hypothetical protein [Pedobacter sp. SYSU D00873]